MKEGGDRCKALGRLCEEAACRYLGRHGYQIIETNFQLRLGEIDIIARQGDTVAFVEVKARRDRRFGEPFEAVGPRKQAKLRSMAGLWLAAHQQDARYRECQFRFDVVSIIMDAKGDVLELSHLRDAFR